jgi:hypothetical protein
MNCSLFILAAKGIDPSLLPADSSVFFLIQFDSDSPPIRSPSLRSSTPLYWQQTFSFTVSATGTAALIIVLFAETAADPFFLLGSASIPRQEFTTPENLQDTYPIYSYELPEQIGYLELREPAESVVSISSEIEDLSSNELAAPDTEDLPLPSDPAEPAVPAESKRLKRPLPRTNSRFSLEQLRAMGKDGFGLQQLANLIDPEKLEVFGVYRALLEKNKHLIKKCKDDASKRGKAPLRPALAMELTAQLESMRTWIKRLESDEELAPMYKGKAAAKRPG